MQPDGAASLILRKCPNERNYCTEPASPVASGWRCYLNPLHRAQDFGLRQGRKLHVHQVTTNILSHLY